MSSAGAVNHLGAGNIAGRAAANPPNALATFRRWSAREERLEWRAVDAKGKERSWQV